MFESRSMTKQIGNWRCKNLLRLNSEKSKSLNEGLIQKDWRTKHGPQTKTYERNKNSVKFSTDKYGSVELNIFAMRIC